MKNLIYYFLILLGSIFFSEYCLSIDTEDTRMLADPAISNSHIAFIYAEDLWIANLDGSNPRRLTIDEGRETNPKFSPNGKWIAFSAEYDGNTDVFLLPVEGGIPKRLTWHPGRDLVRGFTPDGSKVLFISRRVSFTNRYDKLFTVSIDGGFPEELIIPHAFRATYSPDGKNMAYTPIYEAFHQWKNYRGGTISRILLISFHDHSVIEIPKPKEGCNDTDPIWIDNKIYFRSDRNGEFNLYEYNIDSKEIKQLTFFKDFPIIKATGSKKAIIFEQAGYIHTFNISNNEHNKITIGIAADLQELRRRFTKGKKFQRYAHVSPSGKRAVFGLRGEIITVPEEKGDPRNITQTVAANERFPAWSPDGKNIAYFSDASDEYKLCIEPQDGKGEFKTFSISGAGFYALPNWSPDGKKICFVDNGRNLYILDVSSGDIALVDTDEIYFPGAFRQQYNDWSSDSKWLLYTKMLKTNFSQVFLYSIEQKKAFPVTDGLSHASEPIFSPDNKYIFFFASTDAGPVLNWFDQSSIDMEMTKSIYLATLRKDIMSPFMKESDEEEGQKKKEENEDEKEEKKNSKKEEKNEESDTEQLKIDLRGLQHRIIDVPIKAGNYYNLAATKDGDLLYISAPIKGGGKRKLHKYDMKKKEDKDIFELHEFSLSADKKKMLYRIKNNWYISNTAKKPENGKGMLNLDAVKIKIDPVAEWRQIFNEVWRINRDYFYDPNMHGADWKTLKTKYSIFLSHLSCRSDLNRLIRWMCSELSVGHSYSGGGEQLNRPERINVGLLGADFEIKNNLYRIKKIYGGLNWNPKLRSPLTEPGINVQEGDYIIAVDGKKVSADINLFSMFENTAEKIVEITIAANSDGSSSRTVKVVPINNEYALRNRDWVEGNLKKVSEATDNQVAYVYVPNTAGLGHSYFKRYFFPQADRKAIIVDERFNGGGLLADYYIELLTRQYQAHWNTRYCEDIMSPTAMIEGPKIMIIDETAGSGGDMLPWMFRKFNVGTIVGKRTWGGLVGILGFPRLMDGGYITAPNIAIWTNDGFVVENVGVPPDIEVEQWPAEVIKGKDPQLEKAIEIALEQLKKNPPKEYIRPDYPVKVRATDE